MPILKLIHITCVSMSIMGFVVRGALMLADSPILFNRWVKIFPHIVDTVLLGSALILAFGFHLSPFEHPWLLAKIIGLVLYIGLGMVALRRGKTKKVRAMAWTAALAVYCYIVTVAITKSVWIGLI